MSAIYQRARPIHWDEVVGQEHIKGVLRAALEQGRVGHAYLFSGPRGVGKTTTARLIAMTANCTGPTPKPCGECDNCRAVRAGTHPDVLEIDAASNNSVEDVRDLREKVGLAPMRGGKKIYILDEAHMMSRAAFNALLKTLEEPPEHVIFILATTEPEKILPTILSRTQHYRFRRLTAEEIAGKLAGLAQKEGLSADADALHLMGRLADGAMRDGESLLERMLAAGTAVTKRSVEDALGLPPGEQMRVMAGALAMGEVGTALEQAGTLYRAGFAARTVVEGLVEALSQALHAELGISDDAGARLDGADVHTLLRLQAALDEQSSRFATAADELSLELALTHALLAAQSSAPSANARANTQARGAEGESGHTSELERRLAQVEGQLRALSAAGGAAARMTAPTTQVGTSAPPPQHQPQPTQGTAPTAALPTTGGGDWGDVMQAASLQTRAFLKPGRQHAQAGYVSIAFDDKHAFHARRVLAHWDEIAALVLQTFGPVTFELISEAASKKAVLGGAEAAAQAVNAASVPTQQSVPPQAAPASTRVAPASTRNSTPSATPQPPPPEPASSGGKIADFDPLGRAAAAPAPKPKALARVQDSASAQGSASAQSSAELRPAPPPSPDDAAPAPLPKSSPTPPWEDSPAQAPPAPADAAPNTEATPREEAARELYLGEPVTEEPTWDDLAPPDERGAPVHNSGAQAAKKKSEHSGTEQPTQKPQQVRHPAPVLAQGQTQTPNGTGARTRKEADDIRQHPMFAEVTGRFQGQIRDVGANRRVKAEAEPETEVLEDV